MDADHKLMIYIADIVCGASNAVVGCGLQNTDKEKTT